MGRVRGHRGRGGELTVLVPGGDAALWLAARHLWIGSPEGERGRLWRVERSRAYRDRLVLKLEGLDDASAAADLRGCEVAAPPDEEPALPDGQWMIERLVGLEVVDEDGTVIGSVKDVIRTGAQDLLEVAGRGPGGEREILVPLVREIVQRVDLEARRIEVRLPPGLAELNAP